MEEELAGLGVKHVVIPRKGRANVERGKLQRSQRFVKLVKRRTGSEGRIAHRKHSWGWNPTRLDGIEGARTWCGRGVLAHNATKVAALHRRTREHPKDHPPDSSWTMSTHRPRRPPPPDPRSSLPGRASNAANGRNRGESDRGGSDRGTGEPVDIPGRPGVRATSTFSGRSKLRIVVSKRARRARGDAAVVRILPAHE